MFVIGSYSMHFFLGRYLSEQEYGIVGTVITIINFEYIFFTDGVRQGMSRSISELRYEERHLIRTGVFLQLAMIGLFFAGTYGGAGLIAELLGDRALTPYIRGVAWLLPFTGIYSLMLGILNGHKNFLAEAGIGIIYPVLKLSVIPFVLFVFDDAVIGTETGFLTAGVLTMLISVFAVKKESASFLKTKVQIKVWEYLKTMCSYLLLFCVSTIMMNLDTLILKGVSGSNELVGYYTGVATFAKVPYFLLTAFYTVALPLITRNYAAGEMEEAKGAVTDLLSVILSFVLPVAAVVSAASGHILSLFYKPSYRAGQNALSLLSFGIFFLGMMLVFTMILSAADKKKWIVWLSVGMLAAEGILCPVLTKHFSLTGTALATCITAAAGMLSAGICVGSVFGNFWQKKHTLLLILNGAAYAGYAVFFRRIPITNFFILILLCGICYMLSAGIGGAITGLHKKLPFLQGRKHS